jgi:hypothetical protein
MTSECKVVGEHSHAIEQIEETPIQIAANESSKFSSFCKAAIELRVTTLLAICSVALRRLEPDYGKCIAKATLGKSLAVEIGSQPLVRQCDYYLDVGYSGVRESMRAEDQYDSAFEIIACSTTA